MSRRALTGTGVLVTRPASQSKELSDTIEAVGGTVFRLPVIEIVARSEDQLLVDLAALATPDIVVYVSRNAVIFGAPAIAATAAGKATIAAIGPATRSALEEAGCAVSIYPGGGFDSEHLLKHAALDNIRNSNVLIIRGTSGRELLADTLRARGASVSYLVAYERVTAQPDAETLAQLATFWRRGNIDVVIVMSVDSLTRLLDILPANCRPLLEKSWLVTPSQRVIQTALEQLPDVRTTLASGPQATSLVDAVIQSRHETTEWQT